MANETLADSEWRLISDVLARHSGNKTAAARELGISRRTILRKQLAHSIMEVRQKGARCFGEPCDTLEK